MSTNMIPAPEAGNNLYLSEDLERIAREALPFEKMKGRTVLVTGVTGLVGSELIRAFLYINRCHSLGMTVCGIARNEEKVRTVYGELIDRDDLKIIYTDITAPDFVSRVREELPKIAYIIHGAAVTTSKMMVTMPVDTINTAIVGTQNLLELARLAGAESFVYLSSMEVYGDMSIYKDIDKTTEDMLGYIDLQNVRSDYPESKRMCENMCTAYYKQYNVPCKTARLAQTFGAGILPWEGRVFAQFLKSVKDNTDIVLHTKGLSEGNYCYTADVVTGLLTILLKGENGEAYNVANDDNHTTIAGMAQMVADRLAGGKIKVVFDIPEGNQYGYAADTRMHLSGDKLKALGWMPTVDLENMYRRCQEHE